MKFEHCERSRPQILRDHYLHRTATAKTIQIRKRPSLTTLLEYTNPSVRVHLVILMLETDSGTLGYKEFHNYLSAPEHSEEEFKLAIENMKSATRKYAKRQIMWIRNKLLHVANAANGASRAEYGFDVTPTYLLDATGKRQYFPIISSWRGD